MAGILGSNRWTATTLVDEFRDLETHPHVPGFAALGYRFTSALVASALVNHRDGDL